MTPERFEKLCRTLLRRQPDLTALADRLPSDEQPPAEEVELSLRKESLRKAVSALPDSEREIVELVQADVRRRFRVQIDLEPVESSGLPVPQTNLPACTDAKDPQQSEPGSSDPNPSAPSANRAKTPAGRNKIMF